MDPNQLDEAQRFIGVTQTYFCAMYSVVVWDWIISLNREYRFIWKTRWTPVKVAYLFCRYWVLFVIPYLLYAFVADHSLQTCQKIYRIPVALAMWNQVGSESILLIRTYAFFNRNVYILAFLVVAISGVCAYQLYVDTTQMLRKSHFLYGHSFLVHAAMFVVLPFTKSPFDHGPCFPMSKPHSAHLLGFFIAPLLFDTMVTLMTVVKALTIRRRSGSPNSRLIQTFIREGVFYYILISIANLINGVFYLQPRQSMSAINIPLSVMMGPILACRLILDLRQRGCETVTQSEGTGMAAFTTKSGTLNNSSPFTPPSSRFPKGFGGFSHSGTRGSIPQDEYDIDIERDIVEMNNIPFGLGMELGSLNTAVGGEDGEPIEMEKDDTLEDKIPHYKELGVGSKSAKTTSMDNIRAEMRGIRVDIEKSTSTTM
ncbi:hypothetical protein FISHEDRAFT_70962 [Fistulina hepatica ATCC 64428]|uniref:DUF6533 domain-containing protein n=1 Tax=Fistulina hepatica ATCC 64428 TaxID=1128425 RepID=A0A0D7AIB1_9AGAR|nr:hypothetical protein FISHEDRAFT_70962 [Fistulina hepatica ATCC 64428]